MNIWIVGDAFGFPNGYGATARVLAYAKGLQANGANVRVICLKAFERPEDGALNTEPRGVYDGIPFEYACGTTTRGATFLQRRWLEVKGVWGLARTVGAFTRRTKLDAVIIYTTYSLFWTLCVWLVARLVGAKTVLDVCELPFIYHKSTWAIRLQSRVLRRLIFRWVNGFIIISRYLENFVLQCYRSAKFLRVPVLVDLAMFNANGDVHNHIRLKVLYSGNLLHNSEVIGLIEIVGKLAAAGIDLHLQIVGDSGARVRTEIQARAMELGVCERVEFIGAVRRDDLPARLNSADVLVLPRAQGAFSDAGFPTKLGEYLATGKPVVVTSTGEIPFYLQDRVNAFLVPPGDVNVFAMRLGYVLDHPVEAAQVGECGRQVAAQHFDYRVHGKRIIEFIEAL